MLQKYLFVKKKKKDKKKWGRRSIPSPNLNNKPPMYKEFGIGLIIFVGVSG
jgi:hypothetical protein